MLFARIVIRDHLIAHQNDFVIFPLVNQCDLKRVQAVLEADLLVY